MRRLYFKFIVTIVVDVRTSRNINNESGLESSFPYRTTLKAALLNYVKRNYSLQSNKTLPQDKPDLFPLNLPIDLLTLHDPKHPFDAMVIPI